MNKPTVLAPVELSLDLACTAAHAFKVYTADIAQWWPLGSHSVEGDKAQGVVFEARAGGRIYEIGADGTEHLWGTVTGYDEGRLLRHTWHPGRPPEDGIATEVELKFIDLGATSRLELTHKGFEIYGEPGRDMRSNYVTGWQHVAGECFKAAAEA